MKSPVNKKTLLAGITAAVAAVILSALFITACTSSRAPKSYSNATQINAGGAGITGGAGVTAQPEAIPVSSFSSGSAERYTIFYETDNYKLSLYEPPEGCYLGAYILSNRKINFDINEFERLTTKKHSSYLYNMTALDRFPTDFVLNCISSMKTPNISVRPPNDYNPFDKSLVDALAVSFGEFYVPIFIQFYPEPNKKHYDPQAYIEFYRYAKAVFREKASNVSFVWTVDGDTLLDAKDYYPGDEYTDWIGINLYEPIKLGIYDSDVLSKIDYVYFLFQKTKPIMLSQLAISHYSTFDNVYNTDAASKEISRVYGTISKLYPRVKLINYMDYSEINRNKSVADNFSVTENERVLDSYRKAVSDGHFLSIVDIASTGDSVSQLIKSSFTAYKILGEYYLSEDCFNLDLRIRNMKNGIEIDGEKYFPLSFLEKNNLRQAQTDDTDKRIIIRR